LNYHHERARKLMFQVPIVTANKGVVGVVGLYIWECGGAFPYSRWKYGDISL